MITYHKDFVKTTVKPDDEEFASLSVATESREFKNSYMMIYSTVWFVSEV